MHAAPDPRFEPVLADPAEPPAARWGFRTGARGTHTSRTIMLDELSLLLAAVPADADRRHYADAIIDDNCLGKRTAATRRASLQRLRELYGLDARLLLFRFFRDLWERFEPDRPLVALLLALARDPLLRATAGPVLSLPAGQEFAPQAMRDAVSDVAGDRLAHATIDKVVRNAASSWTQSGHLRGRVRKTRQRVDATPAPVACALALGFAAGRRGRRLFDSPWVAVLDAPSEALADRAVEANRLGLIDFRQAGQMMDASFPQALTADREESGPVNRIDTLIERYRRHIALPWRQDLTGGERTIFVVYDKADERRLRLRLERFELAAREAGHGWIPCDLTPAFAEWMANIAYRDSYFEAPEDLDLKLDEDFLTHLADRVRAVLAGPAANAGAVVALFGIASLFGFVRISKLIAAVEGDVRGRLVVFFPGEYENANYRLLDARDGWSYRAVPITVREAPEVYEP